MLRKHLFKSFEDLFFGDAQERMFQMMTTEQKLTEETFEVVKNGVRTNITFKFNEQGYPVSWSHISTTMSEEIGSENLQKQLDEAVEKQDFFRAAEIHKRMKEKEKK